MPRLSFITRGDRSWGMGHLYRTCWLAGILEEQQSPGFDITVHCIDSPEARTFWGSRTQHIEFHQEILLETPPARTIDVAVIDWLDSRPGLVRQLSADGARVALLDDYGPAQAYASLVINTLLAPFENIETTVGRARTASGTAWLQLPPTVTKLRGVAQATTRAMETELAAPPPAIGPVHAVLVSFGGSPAPGLVAKALDALMKAGYAGRVIVIPAPVDHPAAAGLDVEFLPAGDEFHSLFAAADMAVCGGGLTLFEAAFLGVPAICVALQSASPEHGGHQQETCRRLDAAGCCLFAGPAEDVTTADMAGHMNRLLNDPGARSRMSAAGMQLIDGRGLMRTCTAILELLA